MQKLRGECHVTPRIPTAYRVGMEKGRGEGRGKKESPLRSLEKVWRRQSLVGRWHSCDSWHKECGFEEWIGL